MLMLTSFRESFGGVHASILICSKCNDLFVELGLREFPHQIF